jgi:hypothetical protein
MNTIFDSEFQKLINSSTLKWLPWVGLDYNLIGEHRILIIGESHYCDGSESSKDDHQKIDMTRRDSIGNMAIGKNDGKTKLFKNLYKAIMGDDNFFTDKFWNSVCFYNFIQEEMNTIKNRPSHSQYVKSWTPFLNVIEILNPTICVFAGSSSADRLQKGIMNSNYRLKEGKIETHKMIGKTAKKTATLLDCNGNEIKLVFIKHPSRISNNDLSEWNRFLKEQITSELEFLQKAVQ